MSKGVCAVNWFERHLNWSCVLGWLVVMVGAFSFGILMGMLNPDVDADAISVVAEVFGLSFMLLVSGWIIRRKNRSLWWLILFGWLSPLWLTSVNRHPTKTFNTIVKHKK